MHKMILPVVAMIAMAGFVPSEAHAELIQSLRDVKYQLTGVILPVLSVIGVALAAMSFFSGNPQSKQHIFYAILGCIFSAGADAIVTFISQTVR